MRRPYLVTGGAGFIGRNVVQTLLERGETVTIIDNGSAGLPLPAASGRLTVIHGDIRDPATVEQAMPQQADIVHLAALHHIPTCTADPSRTLAINVLGTQILLDAATKADARRLVLASSGAVYGWQDIALSEEAPLGPTDIYGVSKRTNEEQARIWSQQSGANLRIARIFNAIGSGDPHGHLIPDILTRLEQSDDVLPLGALSPRRDYLHVEDVAAGLVALADDPASDLAETYNLCSGTALSVEDLARRLMTLAGRNLRIESRSTLQRPFDRPLLLGDPSKTSERLGWRVRRPLEEALRAIIASHPARVLS
ncbi:NAD-dependent epimerase/dehydratase family protein [Lacibacterium aquatile]|uniref:NAD-dependent epimerase/dehydratase family protein n=1 Tax=Lacibacterium aquatile TaxID=1168082 RepID=A0ABW5DW43_9PROT